MRTNRREENRQEILIVGFWDLSSDWPEMSQLFDETMTNKIADANDIPRH